MFSHALRSLVKALLASEPPLGDRRPNLERAVGTLLAIARGGNNAGATDGGADGAQHQTPPSAAAVALCARVHSLNILRALFRDSRLAEAVAQHVEAALQLAILGIAFYWYIRPLVCSTIRICIQYYIVIANYVPYPDLIVV